MPQAPTPRVRLLGGVATLNRKMEVHGYEPPPGEAVPTNVHVRLFAKMDDGMLAVDPRPLSMGIAVQRERLFELPALVQCSVRPASRALAAELVLGVRVRLRVRRPALAGIQGGLEARPAQSRGRCFTAGPSVPPLLVSMKEEGLSTGSACDARDVKFRP